MHQLNIKILDEYKNDSVIVNYYTNLANKPTHYSGDSGIDLIVPNQYMCFSDEVTMVRMGIACQMHYDDDNNEKESYMLMPWSSIVKTPLMLANSVGLIDKQYTGEIIAAFRCFKFMYTINKGDRLVQLVAFDGKPIVVKLVDELSKTDRGSKGFGSTGSTC